MSKKDDAKIDEEKPSFTVRPMEIYDLAEVYDLGETSFRADLWPVLYRGWDEYEVTTLFDTDGDYCLVAENDNYEPGVTPKNQRIVGFVLGTVMSKSGSAWSYGYIIWLCAHPKWQRYGVAGKLVDKIVETFVQNEGVRIIMADTDPSNERAVKFFQKKGFDQEHKHVFLTSNVENNSHYSYLLHETRAAQAREKKSKNRHKNRTKKNVSKSKKNKNRKGTSS